MTRVMIVHGKHGESYYDATTDEQWAYACLAVLKEHDEMGYYHPPREPKASEMASMTDDQIATLPGQLRDQVLRERNAYRRRVKEYEQELLDHAEIQRVIEDEDISMATVRGWVSPIPLAWRILDQRSDYEYERVELITPTDARPRGG